MDRKNCSFTNILLTLIIIVSGTKYEIHALNRIAKFEFGHFVKPLIGRYENSTAKLKNSDIVVQLKCMANYPTEWIFDDDTISVNNRNGRIRLEWTDRKFQNTYLEDRYNYIAWIHLQYNEVFEPDKIYCKAVGNFEYGIKLTLTPINSNEEVLIYPEVTELKDILDIHEEKSYCPIHFYLNKHLDGRFSFKCKIKSSEGSEEANGHLEFNHECPSSAAQCSNTFRSIRVQEKCITVSENEEIHKTGWIKADFVVKKPSVILCKGLNGERGSMEVFFSGIGKATPRSIHTSKYELKYPNELLTLNLNETVFYTGETIKGECIVPKYGFSFDPVFVVNSISGSSFIEDRNYVENDEYEERVWLKRFNLQNLILMEDKYTIACIAPVWNTTEWANLNKTVAIKSKGLEIFNICDDVNVQKMYKVDNSINTFPITFVEPIDPYFEDSTSNITFKLGESNKEIKCIAEGDPSPEVSWDFTPTTVARADKNTIKFLKVTDYIVGIYICQARNRFGKTATKVFLVNVESPESYEDKKYFPATSLDSTTLIAVVVSVIVVIILAVIVVIIIYCKFVKLGSQLVTYLTYEEVKEFTEGKRKTSNNIDDEYGRLGVDYLPYNSSYEVASRDHLIHDESSILGSGEYGIVMNGKLKIKGSFVDVAVKTVKKDVNISYFKALLSELKIMAYIGTHENIITLMGAWTSNIKSRKQAKLCKISLLKYLQTNKASFRNFVQDGMITSHCEFKEDPYANVNSNFSTYTLLKWSAEIAAGMEFLVSKNVIHGDLAARNILLSNNLVSKICDFGLARQLIDYNYIKSQSCPLPWKWMSIESLAEMKFSHKSDVWAYGVTVWEMFSLGMSPYPGSAWSMDFIDQLRQGLRMSCPLYCPRNIYLSILSTWNENTKDRPNFTELKEFFHNCLLKEKLNDH